MLRDELKSSVVKNEILRIINEIDNKHVGFSRLFKQKALVKEKVYPDFITKQIDLPDLLFLQYVILELKKSQYEKSVYKNPVLETALRIKKTLLKPHVNKSEQLTFAIFFGGVLLCQSWICLIAAGGFLLSDHIAEWRLNKELENRLALKFNNGQIAKLDSYDSKMDAIEKIGQGGIKTIEKSMEYVSALSKR